MSADLFHIRDSNVHKAEMLFFLRKIHDRGSTRSHDYSY